MVQPFLQALNRMQERVTARPEAMADAARRLLDERLGIQAVPVEAAFAHATAGLLADHTHYFDGFAFLMPLPVGVAVAVRLSGEPCSRAVMEGSADVCTFDAYEPERLPAEPMWLRLVRAGLRRFGSERQVDVAVVSSVPSCCTQALLSSLGVALARALQALLALPVATPDVLRAVRAMVEAAGIAPFSVAYPIAADSPWPHDFVLVDTATLESLPVEAPSRDALGWGLISTGPMPPPDVARFAALQQRASTVLDLLVTGGFSHLTSLRDLDHADLQRAINLLPREERPVLHYLVTENRRVQKMVVAARRSDWQMLGALLLMSHASRRNDWNGSTPEADFIVEQTETMSIEGMYGASLIGRSTGVMLTGQPYTVAGALDRIAHAFEERFGHAPETLLL